MERGGFEPHFAPAGHRRPLRYLGRSMLPVFPGCQLVSTTTLTRLSGLSEVCRAAGCLSLPGSVRLPATPPKGCFGRLPISHHQAGKGERKKETSEPSAAPGNAPRGQWERPFRRGTKGGNERIVKREDRKGFTYSLFTITYSLKFVPGSRGKHH